MSNLPHLPHLPRPVDCDNENCHLNANNVRYWMDAYSDMCGQHAREVENRINRDIRIMDLNREIQKLQKDLQAYTEYQSSDAK